jgi:N-formylglutamate amidohydrolase
MSVSSPETANPLPVIQFSPHAGLKIPTEVKDMLQIAEADIYNDADLWAELHFDFSNPDLGPLVPEGHTLGTLCTVDMDVARALVDANRLPVLDDNPDGAVKAQTSYGVSLYPEPLERSVRQLLFGRYYLGYHQRVCAALEQHLGEAKLLLDCHNMAQLGPSTYAFAGEPRPLLCISNVGDRNGEAMADLGETACSSELLHFAADAGSELFCDMELLEAGPETGRDKPIVALNWPFRGGYFMCKYSRIDTPGRTVPMMMIEVNRGLFIGNQSGDSPIEPPSLERIAQVRRRLYQLTTRIVEFISQSEPQ